MASFKPTGKLSGQLSSPLDAGGTKLTKNFTLSEFTRSETAKKYKLPNTPPPEAIENLRYLCTQVLQPLRDAIGVEISVSSGYRSPEVNLKAGGVPNSQHENGEAADISAKGWNIEDLARKIFELGLPVDQVIIEYDQNVIHVSIKRPRFQYLTRFLIEDVLQYAVFDPAPVRKKSGSKNPKGKSSIKKVPKQKSSNREVRE